MGWGGLTDWGRNPGPAGPWVRQSALGSWVTAYSGQAHWRAWALGQVSPGLWVGQDQTRNTMGEASPSGP